MDEIRPLPMTDSQRTMIAHGVAMRAINRRMFLLLAGRDWRELSDMRVTPEEMDACCHVFGGPRLAGMDLRSA